MGKDEETEELIKIFVIRCSTLDVRCSTFSLFYVGRSSFKTTRYGINV